MNDRGTRAAGEDQASPPPGPASPSCDPFVPWSRAFARHVALWLMAAAGSWENPQLTEGCVGEGAITCGSGIWWRWSGGGQDRRPWQNLARRRKLAVQGM